MTSYNGFTEVAAKLAVHRDYLVELIDERDIIEEARNSALAERDTEEAAHGVTTELYILLDAEYTNKKTDYDDKTLQCGTWTHDESTDLDPFIHNTDETSKMGIYN